MRRKTEQDYHDLASSRGFEWLGPYTGSVINKTNWRCSKGHEWSATYSSIGNTGTGCQVCSERVPKTVQDYHDLAKSRGLEWLGPHPGNANKSSTWICLKKHTWPGRYNDIRVGVGCPHCAGNVPKNELDYHDLAQNRNFKWVGKMPKGTDHKTRWQCPRGHKWSATYHNVNSGSGCPGCRTFKGPVLIAKTLQSIGIDFETEMKFSACKYKRPLPFDFFVPAANLLIEYQGEHHFKSIWGPLSNVKRNDKIKKDWAERSPYELLIINYWDYDRIAEILADRLKDYAMF